MKVGILLGTMINTAQGPANALQHDKVLKVDVKEPGPRLVLEIDGGVEVVYNMNILVSYTIDKFASVLRAPGA